MRTLYIKSLFAPNERYVDICANSIMQNVEKITKSGMKISKIFFIGWCAKPMIIKIQKKIKIIMNKCGMGIKYDSLIYKLNYGKYRLFKDISKVCDIECYDYIMYSDHDILFKDYNYLSTSIRLVEGESIGIITFNQKNDNKHILNGIGESHKLDEYQYIEKKKNDNTIYEFAFGFFITSLECMMLISKNIEIKSVYGMDEKHIQNIMFDNGKKNIMFLNMYVTHPYDDNDMYSKWKENITKLFFANDDIYNSSLEGSINLWEEYNNRDV